MAVWLRARIKTRAYRQPGKKSQGGVVDNMAAPRHLSLRLGIID